MNKAKTLAAAVVAAVALAGSPAQAKGEMEKSVYMFGMAASFADSTVYFTNVQQVDSVWIDSKTDFLLGRDNYALQLKHYLAEARQEPNRTCIVVFSKSKSKAEKKLKKMLTLYSGGKKRPAYDVRHLEEADFHFLSVDMAEAVVDE